MEGDKAICIGLLKREATVSSRVHQINRQSELRGHGPLTYTHTQNTRQDCKHTKTMSWKTLKCGFVTTVKHHERHLQSPTHWGPADSMFIFTHDLLNSTSVSTFIVLTIPPPSLYDLDTWRKILCCTEKPRTADQDPNMLVRWISIMCIDDRIDGVEIA